MSRLSLISACFLFFANAAAAAGTQPNATLPADNPPALRGISADQPIDIGADAASLREKDRVVVLSGNVVARQGTVELKADKVTVHYLPGAKPNTNTGIGGNIERLVAEGNVVVTRPGETVKSATATYEMAARQIVMAGHVVAMKDGNVVRGERVIVDLANETMRLDMGGPTSGRVQGVFRPPPQTKKP
ncbi:MAG: lipopolysaccharide transport periplasmic protein LptA [Alphaproteobacteria bacterium]